MTAKGTKIILNAKNLIQVLIPRGVTFFNAMIQWQNV